MGHITPKLIALFAVAKITMGSISADGLELRDLSCELDGGGLFGGLAVVGALAKQKPAIDACAPDGATFGVDFAFHGGRTTAKVATGGETSQRACVQRALARVHAPLEGRCTAKLLAGSKR